ncbi:hypothetical protein AX774_g1791 [Zancudomyces culisetae]|nr:hypothetical protein AX774_g1791 [Zancudomyces culisetae]|eukprot:OMH84679.1 hypothetical protein AX774_g1791 [Zancudomyces culisetae]
MHVVTLARLREQSLAPLCFPFGSCGLHYAALRFDSPLHIHHPLLCPHPLHSPFHPHPHRYHHLHHPRPLFQVCFQSAQLNTVHNLTSLPNSDSIKQYRPLNLTAFSNGAVFSNDALINHHPITNLTVVPNHCSALHYTLPAHYHIVSQIYLPS